MIYSMKLEPTMNVHPARIAAANGGENPYSFKVSEERTALSRALCSGWHHDARGWRGENRSLTEANELTRIQLASN